MAMVLVDEILDLIDEIGITNYARRLKMFVYFSLVYWQHIQGPGDFFLILNTKGLGSFKKAAISEFPKQCEQYAFHHLC